MPFRLSSLPQLLHTQMTLGMIAAESSAVIWMRMLGMGGMWSVTPHENTRMVTEKTAAYGKAANAAMEAAMKGHNAERVLAASFKPIRQATRANACRLTKRSLKLPK